jgi:hypothetical protein
MANKQTAVEWLEDELAKNLKHIVLKEDYILMESLFEQAKQMEKEQIKDSFDEGFKYDINNGGGEQYYNETYGN